MFEFVLILGSSILVPTGLLILATKKLRAFLFIVALLFGFGSLALLETSGADNPLSIIPWLGFCVAAGAALAEVVSCVWQFYRRRKRQNYKAGVSASCGR